MTDPQNRIWLVTGASRGLGRAFTEAALGNGDSVVATARHPEAMKDLTAHHPDHLLTLEQDVRDPGRSREVVDETISRFGRVDVLVNNAGYGLVGTIEEVSEAQVTRQVETNFLGALWMSQAVLPSMRERGSGEIVQISTVGAVGSMPAFGLYNASKWALEGFSEALAAEVGGLGIRVTIAELGGFATDWAWGSLEFADTEPAYNDLRRNNFGTARFPWDMSAQAEETNDAAPEVAARKLIDHLDSEGGPLRLVVGDDAPAQIGAALERRRDDYSLNEGFSWPGPAT